MFSKEAISVFHELMSSTYQIEIVFCQALFKLFVTEDPAAASLVFFPVSSVFVWVVPDQVGNNAVVWKVSWFDDCFNLIE